MAGNLPGSLFHRHDKTLSEHLPFLLQHGTRIIRGTSASACPTGRYPREQLLNSLLKTLVTFLGMLYAPSLCLSNSAFWVSREVLWHWNWRKRWTPAPLLTNPMPSLSTVPVEPMPSRKRSSPGHRFCFAGPVRPFLRPFTA